MHRPTGPKLLSAYDMAVIMGRVLGRRVRTVNLPMWMFLRAARMQGVSAFELSGFRHYTREHRQGVFEPGGGTNNVDGDPAGASGACRPPR